ncbi:hypothetical protein EOE67_16080 [Rheinheimera riviphila]|uniref:Uncharacterized protein n=1 Tax=Rheinheimera riviphila TaxID=1834037 RepID=A0A437QGJ1_9GAMM|nr:hypothetical protein [Rheinheimera riviphila]RVU33534.1 hypothetical protein EOE67_16080 [Rheinheimera riviphila]
MRVLNVSFIIFLSLLISSFLFFKKEAIACEAITLIGFEEIHSNVYSDSSLTSEQRSSLRNTINQAHDRIEQVYGVTKASPRIIATNNLEYKKFGLNPTGMQNSGFFRECIFLGPKGLNVDVIAHGLVHAEVRYRTNFLVEHTELPAWFIEGTGIKVDYRIPFLIENISVSKEDVEQIKSVFFFHNFPNTSVKSYQASRIAIEALEPKSLYFGLERLNNGEKFEEVFGL